MKNLFILFTSLVFMLSCRPKEQAQADPQLMAAIETFVAAADRQDAEKLAFCTHKDFRVIWNGPKPTDHTLFARDFYLEKFRIKEWGGDPRTIELVDWELFENYASAHVRLDGEQQDFESMYILVKEGDQWKMIQESVVVKPSA